MSTGLPPNTACRHWTHKCICMPDGFLIHRTVKAVHKCDIHTYVHTQKLFKVA